MRSRIGLVAAIGTLASALVLAGCAGVPMPERTSLPLLTASDTDPKKGFESPAITTASQVVPAGLRKGPHHEVDETVGSDGFMRIYTLHSDFGEFPAHGDDLLRIRVAEVGALAELGDMSSGDEFGQALAATAKSPFIATWNLVTSPVRTISGIPRGAANALRSAADASSGDRSEFEDGALASFFGFERDKRKLAVKLGVDPYSSNLVLQEELNRIAWVTTVGSLPTRLLPLGDEDAPPPMTAGLGTERVGGMLLDYPPEDMRRINRIELSVMGVPEKERNAFVGHKWYSPLRQSQVVAHLAAMDLTRDRATFIETALGAASEEDVILYERTAELLRRYHENRDPIVRIIKLDDILAGLTADGSLVVAIPIDHAVWTRPLQRTANLLFNARLGDGEITDREILVTGTLSERARNRMAFRKIKLTEKALEKLRPLEAESH